MTDRQTKKWQERICAIFIEELKMIKNDTDSGKCPKLIWTRPWSQTSQKSLVSKHEYQGFNQLLLSLISYIKEYPDSRWLTYNQLISHNRGCDENSQWHIAPEKIAVDGGHLFTVRYLRVQYRHKDKPGYYSSNQKEKMIRQSQGRIMESDFTPIRSIGYHRVYNVSIVEGIKNEADNDSPVRNVIAKSKVDRFLENEELCVVHVASNRAFYDWGQDKIVMPLRSAFKSEEAYYMTLLHEIAHATGAKHRLNRPLKSFDQRSAAYAIEELVAELSSVLLNNELNIRTIDEQSVNFNNNLAYLDSWIVALKQSPEVLWDVLEQAVAVFDYFKKSGRDPTEK
ncbi:MAG: zincin-like metallopeptidase domain-containing protein [Erysipelotrichaceae bacterium]|nr:zincin-like metallopeptidase domain-containing protein [Erysipelotrichaceae bacterium]MDD3809437.1 zincin-like metallopeptidase domain-containing protein [Erysipelotrichaceae bacterium]